jgi:long-chain acyl-CoA synthetase
MNLALWLQTQARVAPQRPAVAWGTETIHTQQGLADAAARCAAGLQARGLQPGDRVGLYMANAPDYLVALWGAWWAGLVVVPMNARLHGREAAWIAAHSGQRLCLADAEHAAALAPYLAEAAPDCALLAALAPLLDPHPTLPAPLPRDEGDAAWLFYTSGTTGRPKGVTLTQRNLRLCTLAYTATVQAVAPGDAFLHPAPLSHGSGLYHLPYVMNCGVNVIPRSASLDEAEFFALAAFWRNASTFAAPTIVKRLAEFATAQRPPLDGLATIVYGGAPMYLADLRAARAALGPHLAQIYGQGECPMTITVLPRAMVDDQDHPQWAERMASVGVAQPVVEVSVREFDAASSPPEGRALAIGETGEVCVRGEVVMAGYWQDAAATAATLRGGWLCTGDVGRLDAQGFLTLLDRSKDLVISGGNNIYPREIEELLLTHPAVAEVSVIGRPDTQWGEALVAYVVRRAPHDAGVEADTAAALDAHCLDHIARYKRPKAWRFVPALPKNNYGKVLKTELRRQESQRSAD